MLEISRRHSVMLHRSCIPSFEIERATMNFHDQRGPSRASLHGLRSQVAFERKPKDEIFACFGPLPAVYPAEKKKRTPGLIFGSPAAGTPVRRGGALVRRPATAGPPGATPKPISACFMGRGCITSLERVGCPFLSTMRWSGCGTPPVSASRPACDRSEKNGPRRGRLSWQARLPGLPSAYPRSC